jgi:hypothetical protein
MERWDWKAVVLDESHNLTTARTTAESDLTRSIHNLVTRARRCVMLTGLAYAPQHARRWGSYVRLLMIECVPLRVCRTAGHHRCSGRSTCSTR